MRYYVGNLFYGDDLLHYRTPGSKNGVRRYQYPGGSLTPEGRIHYNRPLPKKKRGRFALEKLFGRKKKYKVASTNVSKRDKRELSEYSDEELKAKTSRLKVENEYLTERNKKRDLTTKKKKEISKGKEILLKGFMDYFKSVSIELIKASMPNNGGNNEDGKKNNKEKNGGKEKKDSNDSGTKVKFKGSSIYAMSLKGNQFVESLDPGDWNAAIGGTDKDNDSHQKRG